MLLRQPRDLAIHRREGTGGLHRGGRILGSDASLRKLADCLACGGQLHRRCRSQRGLVGLQRGQLAETGSRFLQLLRPRCCISVCSDGFALELGTFGEPAKGLPAGIRSRAKLVNGDSVQSGWELLARALQIRHRALSKASSLSLGVQCRRDATGSARSLQLGHRGSQLLSTRFKTLATGQRSIPALLTAGQISCHHGHRLSAPVLLAGLLSSYFGRSGKLLRPVELLGRPLRLRQLGRFISTADLRDTGDEPPNTVTGVFIGIFGLATLLREPIFDPAESVSTEQPLQELGALAGVAVQESSELTLRQQDYLVELLGRHAQQVRQLGIHLADALRPRPPAARW